MNSLIHDGALQPHDNVEFPLTKTKPSGDYLRSINKWLPNAFPDGLGVVPNNPVIAAVLAALLKAGPKANCMMGGWHKAEDGRLCYRHAGKRGGEILIYVKYAGSHRSVEEQWDLISELNVFSADILLIILAQMCEPSMINRTIVPDLEPITLSASMIMRYKKMVRWGEERLAFQDQIAKHVAALSRLRFDIIDFPAWDPSRRKWNQDGITILGDKIFDITDHALVPGKNKKSECDDYFWSICFGHWATSWVNGLGKVWLGPMPHDIVTFDHRLNRGTSVIAKKIAMNSVLLWGALRGRAHLDRRMDHLLESIGELPFPEARGGHWAGRMFDRVSEASMLLDEKDVLHLTFASGECVPFVESRYKGWVKDWLGSKLVIERPKYV